ncbi:MAG: GMC oxidoreductase [Alphaproteobacteria bacterium]
MRFDYVVVGAGSAGCVVANRLVRDRHASVLLLEAGGDNRQMLIDMPAGAFKILFSDSPLITRLESSPQPSLDGRKIVVDQAKVLGGGSSVNALAYTRGARADYESWNRAANGGWGWDDLLPYFIRQEGNQRFSGPTHGASGPWKVSDAINVCRSSELFVETLQAMGVSPNPDFNSGQESGVGWFQTSTYHAKRCSAANAFIDPIRDDRRLTISTLSTATRLLFKGGRALGVEYTKGGAVHHAYADEAVILTAGAYQTPKLLMLSGIGPADHLKTLKIEVREDLPGVGQNMLDHNMIGVAAYTNGQYGYFGADRFPQVIGHFLRYVLFGKGPIASNGSESTAFINLDSKSEEPHLQIYNVGTMWLRPGQGKPSHGITLMANLLKPKSRGSMALRSSNPLDPPMISPNYLSHEDDLALSIRGFRYLREILKSRPLADIVDREVVPGVEVDSDEQIAAYCKANTRTNHHPVGSCRMGTDNDPFAVVDPALKVRGIEGLFIFDASVFPDIPSANTNATVMAVADKGVTTMIEKRSG